MNDSAARLTEELETSEDGLWLEAFRRGDREALEQCYRRYYRVVEGAIGTILGLADRETVIHEVFLRLLTEHEMRQSFTGPSLGAWLATIARNRAVDVSRRARREDLVSEPLDRAGLTGEGWDDGTTVARLLLDRFRSEHLPPALAPLFEARFMREMSQREAAQYLGMRRTTLAYQELQLRRRLRIFMLETAE